MISWNILEVVCFFEKHNFYYNKDGTVFSQKHDFLNISQETVRSGVFFLQIVVI